MFVYVAGAIDLDVSKKPWRKLVYAAMKTGYTIFDPCTAFVVRDSVGSASAKWIEEINTLALSKADWFICYISKHVSSVGTPIELNMAHKAGKAIILITDIQPFHKSVYLANRVLPERVIDATLPDIEIVNKLASMI